MKIVVLCGGRGIRLKDQADFNSKALVYIDEKPIIWHILKRYSLYGFNDFILALGKFGNQIRDYFLNYSFYTNDIEFDLGRSRKMIHHNSNQEENWRLTFVNTGSIANTGSRLFRCQKYINTDCFMLAYSDCLANVDFKKLISFHQSQDTIGTVTGVTPIFRHGEFVLKRNKAVDFNPTSRFSSNRGLANGGFMVFNRKIFNFLSSYNECSLETDVFPKLVERKQLSVFKHQGFWQCLDNNRDYDYLINLCQNNKRDWLKER